MCAMKNQVYSIGYGNRTIKEFIELIKEVEFDYLLDVRSSPYSNFNDDFSKHNLIHYLKVNNIKYAYFGDSLGGIPGDPAAYSKGKVDYDKLSKLDFFSKGISRILNAISKNYTVLLMCSEKKPENCHRSKLIGEVLLQNHINIIHIDENGKYKTQEEIIIRLRKGQFGLFDEERKFSSRKNYMEIKDGGKQS